MASDWNNNLIDVDSVTGTVTVISTWSVWDCKKKEWNKTVPPVVLRNTMLGALYPKPEDRFCIGEISKEDTNPNLLAPFTPPDSKKFSLDLASNSRTHGRFTFNMEEVGQGYYGSAQNEQWKRIIYGSIVHTGCKQLVYRRIKYIVVDDTRRNEKGQLQDDKLHQWHWNTGDSHAKGSSRLMSFLGTGQFELNEDTELDTPIQFRMVVRDSWVGKGTIAYNSHLDTMLGGEYDLVIPVSCLKGKKPAFGVHEDVVLMGLVFEGEERVAKPGWMFFQWFPKTALTRSNGIYPPITTALRSKCEKLASAYNSIKDLAEILKVSQEKKDEDLVNPNADIIGNEEQSEAEYISPLIRIIEVDVHGVLLLHPYIVRKIQERLQLQWLVLATAAGVRFYSVMCQPDETLDFYYKDGAPDGRKVMCAPDFKPGFYIVFCNPMRHWGDCQIWENIHTGPYKNGTGLIAATRKQLLGLGRDTDGDFMQLISVKRFPALASAIAEFGKPPDTEKFPKMALQGNMRQIAINSMNNNTGIAASLLGRAAAANIEQHFIDIPPGGLQTQTQNMRIIDFLSQQIQIAVDSLKSAYPNNVNGLNAVTKYIDEAVGKDNIPWLKGFKDKKVYAEYPCPVNPDATDTVSAIVKLVNSHWKKPDLAITSSPVSFKFSLFKLYPENEIQQQMANEVRFDYAKQINAAIEWKEANNGDTSKIKEVSALFKSKRDGILAIQRPDGKTYSAETWAAAYWQVCHTSEAGSAGLVFLLWIDEIIAELSTTTREIRGVVVVYGLANKTNSYPLGCKSGWMFDRQPSEGWGGILVKTRVVWWQEKDASGNPIGLKKMGIDMLHPTAKKITGYNFLGFVDPYYASKLQIGETRDMRIYTHKVKNGIITEAFLFDPNMMTVAEMEDFVRNPPNKKEQK
ncbi:MAG: hypothetical protein JGK33_08995 [Microcoleus sp. PH2017_11_PCY_U_A]|uniref:hypothetical protein n=1 Tax=unclassified Microcoleus TaxID=2642155 RepID=UPI001DC26BE5|nr:MULTISPECIES: hypothetical protein [unclassified Microcoleus]MCC3459795.1 hypothetical protein [Microcoleus sp. PH2017_11_PCY_U_A]MCC3478228.1 hypothetical protein [Microcoleus sp. PH2017_12_PCY_D_A]